MAGSSRIKSANFRINNKPESTDLRVFPNDYNIIKKKDKAHSNTSAFCHKGIASGSFDSFVRLFFPRLFQSISQLIFYKGRLVSCEIVPRTAGS